MSLEERIEYAKMKARHRRKLRPWYLKPWGILSLLLIAIMISLVIASSIYVIRASREYSEKMALEEQKRLIREYEEAIRGDIKNQSFGNPSAPLTIVQFSDFACPYCADSALTVLAFKDLYSEQIHFIHRDYPMYANSVNLALAGQCAAEQEKFWEMYEQLFKHQDRFINLGEEELILNLVHLGDELGLKVEQFANCLTEQKHLSTIANDHRDSEFLDLQGTPTWFINNNPLVGHLPTTTFMGLIESLLLDM